MKYCLCIIAVFACLSARAQGYSDKIKLLGQHGVPYFYNADIEKAIEKWKQNEKNATSDVLGRSVNWYREMEVAQKTNGLPWFIKFIPAANTGYNNLHEGEDGSKGMWPLNFSIAKKYGLKLNSFIDERRNVDFSSDAACKYLSDLHNIYRDWLKTITAFRIGAIRLNQVIRLAGNSLDFEDIYKHLSEKEREPIVQFYAAVTVMYFRHDFNIQETVFVKPATDTASTEVGLPFIFLEDKLQIPVSEIRELNPEFSTDLVPYFGSTTYFRLPANKKEQYNSMKDSFELMLAAADPAAVVVYDTIYEVRDSVTYVIVKPRETANTQVNDPGVLVDSSASKVWVWYRVKSGDGFYTLSDVFDCSIEQMKNWNGIRNNALIANTLIKFYVPSKKLAFYKSINGMTHGQKKAIALQD